MTNQKKLLIEEIKSFSSFFNAIDLYNNIIKKNPKVGLATVYRFLSSLENNGNIHSFVCENRKIYSMNKTNHAHFTCKTCGKLKHINIKNIDFLDEITGDEICHFQIELTDTCSECKESTKTKI